MNYKKLLNRLVPWIVPILLIALWEYLTYAGILPPSESASPSAVVNHLASLALFKEAQYTVVRLVLGVCIGTLLGVCIGVILARARLADRLFSPTLQFLAPIPIIVWFPFLIMIFGIGDYMRVAFVATAAFFLVYVHTFQAARSLDRDYMELGRIYQKSYWLTVRDIVLPSAASQIFMAVRISLALGWIVVAFAEFGLKEDKMAGLGWFIMQAKGLGQVENEFAGIVLLGIVGAIIDRGLNSLQKRALAWTNVAEA